MIYGTVSGFFASTFHPKLYELKMWSVAQLMFSVISLQFSFIRSEGDNTTKHVLFSCQIKILVPLANHTTIRFQKENTNTHCTICA